MAFTKQVPEWNAVGVEPPQSLKDGGWQAGVKPPADYFNWLQNKSAEAIQELQQKAGEVKTVNGQTPDANGNVTVSVDTSELATKQSVEDLEQDLAAHQTDFTNLAIGKKITLNVTSDFKNKVSGSTIENPNKAKRSDSTNTAGLWSTLEPPSSGKLLEFGGAFYNNLNSIDGNYAITANNSNTNIAQELFSFNIIEILTRKYGVEIFGGATTLAEKVAKAKTIITNITCNWNGYGSSPSGTKAYLDVWNAKNGTWDGYPISHLYGSVKKLTKTYTTTAYVLIDSNGFVHYIAYADPSNGTTQSVINTDYINLDITASVSALVDLKNDITELDNVNYLSTIKSLKDVNGVFTKITYKRKSDGTVFATSVLSGGTSPQYTTRTLTFFETDGTTVKSTKVFTLSYDSDGDLISEV